MGYEIDSLGPALGAEFDDIIDVRSPAEFAEDHLPGAINLPAFSNAERAEVGTLYVQSSPFAARKVGAAILARNVAQHLEGPLAKKDGSWKPLIYCWRGGQRSGGVTTILSQIGWRAERVNGGYQSYRRSIVAMLYKSKPPHRFILLDGNTGSGKTAILAELARRGLQVLDLEAMANHKGSLLGASLSAQPTQKMFETRLAQALSGFDPAQPVLVEAESSKIGACLIPSGVWARMKAAPRIAVETSLDARADFLVTDYADILADPDLMAERLDRLRPLCGHARVEAWLDDLKAGRLTALARDLMAAHYDPGYIRARNKQNHIWLGTVRSARLDPTGISDLADQVELLVDQTEART